MQAAIVYDGNIDSENDFEDDFGGSSVASSFADHAIFLSSDHSSLEDDLAPVNNPDILQRVELQRRSTGFYYDNGQGSKKESEDDASSDSDDSVKSIDDDRDEVRAREKAEFGRGGDRENEDSGRHSLIDPAQTEASIREDTNDGNSNGIDSDDHGGVFFSQNSTQLLYGNRFGSNRIQTKGGVPSRPKAKYGSRTMRRDLRRAGGFDSEEDLDEEMLGSAIFAAGPDQSSSLYRLLRFGTQGDHQPGDDASLPGTMTKLSRRSSLDEYIYPSRTKRGKTMRAPVDFRRLIVVVAVCAAMTFTIGLSKHGMGHVDKQLAKQIQELERRAKEMQSPSEKLRSAMYANSLQNIPNAEESEKVSIAVDAAITTTNVVTSTDTSTPHIGGQPRPPQHQAEVLSNEHKTIQVQGLLPETMNQDLGSPSSKTLPTSFTTTVGAMSSQQDVQHLPHMEQVEKLSPEIMKVLTPEQQQQFLVGEELFHFFGHVCCPACSLNACRSQVVVKSNLLMISQPLPLLSFSYIQIMTFQRMQYQNQLERMKAAISKAPEEVKRLLGIPLEAVKRRMNLRHQNKGNLRKMQNAMPAEIIEISPEENLYYGP